MYEMLKAMLLNAASASGGRIDIHGFAIMESLIDAETCASRITVVGYKDKEKIEIDVTRSNLQYALDAVEFELEQLVCAA